MNTVSDTASIADQVVVVVPTIRSPRIKQFLDAWQWPCQVIVVEDNPEQTFDLPVNHVDGSFMSWAGPTHYAWWNIRQDLGADEWIIPRRTDCIRSYGFWKAYQTGKPYIVTLDDDCLPWPLGTAAAYTYLQAHVRNLQTHSVDRWWNTLQGEDYPRGYPYGQWMVPTPVGISHGLWRGVPDFDSPTQLHRGRSDCDEPMYSEGHIPRGLYFPMCGMNLAWRREYTPLMYFLLMGRDHQGNRYPFDRFGDIWCGIIAKKILDHLGVAVWSGAPFVQHERASNVWTNFDKEHEGIKANESFWQKIDSIQLLDDDILPAYQRIAQALKSHPDRYWPSVSIAMKTWAALYE